MPANTAWTQFQMNAGQVYVNTWHGTPLKAMGYFMVYLGSTFGFGTGFDASMMSLMAGSILL